MRARSRHLTRMTRKQRTAIARATVTAIELVLGLAAAAGCEQTPNITPQTTLPATDLPCEVQTVMATRCWACHGDTPTTVGIPSLTSVAAFTAASRTDPSQAIGALGLARMQSTTSPMPPPPATAATAAEIAVIADWVAVRRAPAASPDLQLLIFGAVVARLRGQGADVAVPHLAPRRPYRGADVGSVLLAGVLLKMGGYGFIRIALPMLPDAAQTWAPWIGLLAVIAIVYASLACLAQKDLKRLIAFSSVGHMGFVMLGIATLTTVGINAAIFGMVAHGVITGMLFFGSGRSTTATTRARSPRSAAAWPSVPKLAGSSRSSRSPPSGSPGWPGSGARSWRCSRRSARAAGLDGAVPQVHDLRRDRDDPHRRLLPVDAPAREPRHAAGPVEGERASATSSTVEWVAWVPLLVGIVVLGLFPRLIFGVTERRRAAASSPGSA